MEKQNEFEIQVRVHDIKGQWWKLWMPKKVFLSIWWRSLQSPEFQEVNPGVKIRRWTPGFGPLKSNGALQKVRLQEGDQLMIRLDGLRYVISAVIPNER